MGNNNNQKGDPGSNSDFDWASAMKDLEEAAEGAGASSAKPHQTPAPAPRRDPDRPLTKYEELCRKPSIALEKGDVRVMSELSEILGEVNDLLRDLEKYNTENPGHLREHYYRTIIGNLRDTAHMMFREFQALRNGRLNKTYDKKYVCGKCHQVFMMPLPADNICDECRASMVPKSAPY